VKKIGIFGGTFDPVHIGHLRAAEEFGEALGLETVLMMVSGVPPHRPAPSTTTHDRLEMLRLAVQGNPLLEVSDLELRREGPSFTLDTVRKIRGDAAGAIPYLALGVDAYLEIGTWHKPGNVLAEAHITVLTRPGFDVDLLSPIHPEFSREYSTQGNVLVHRSGATLRKIRVTSIDISSSVIRALAQKGRSFRYLVSEKVFEYIQRNSVYRPEAGIGRKK
jgi:nicotinate-nucleotide adenylyltransferase